MNNTLTNYKTELLKVTEKHHFTLTNEKTIPYGVSLTFALKNESICLNIYYSKKKGISTVIKSKSPLKSKLEAVLAEIYISKKINFHNWKRWIGSDESGKGDFFGPLVVAAFYCTNSMEKGLIKIGVKDSKKLKDNQIMKIAEKVKKLYPNNIKVIILNPQKYNEVYNKFRNQNKKLNELLAWMHSRMILDLRKKFEVDGILIDKFTNDRVIKSSIKSMKSENIMLQTKAESDIAVATASIVARYHFVKKMEELEQKFDLKFSKGASNIVISQAHNFVKKYSRDRLNEIAKLHFKTTKKIDSR
ncbi:MAG: ribonuclease HIII [Candidatus Cloacimonadota bacterium]|nr:ribonuclease HIII [Candidatus Cloacimonadota bacterium]